MVDTKLTDKMIERWKPLKDMGYRMGLNTETGHGRVHRDGAWVFTLPPRFANRYNKKFYFGKIETREEFEFAVNKMISYMEKRFLKLTPEKKFTASHYLDLVANLGGKDGQV